MQINEFLKNNILIFDGAMGTYYASKNGRRAEACELANLNSPDSVLEIHKEYLLAGANAIKTNTFGANRTAFPEETCESIIDEGWRLAKSSGAEYVFADIGPIQAAEDSVLFEEFKFVAERFISLGAKNFLFETQSETGVLPQLSAYIKERCPESFIIVSFAALPDGFTRSGIHIRNIFSELENCDAIDCLGLNCVSSARHMVGIADTLAPTKKHIAFMPNSGYPTILGTRPVYSGSSGYFTEQIILLADHGANIIGGCCGTTPEHISCVCAALKNRPPKPVNVPAKETKSILPEGDDLFFKALQDPTCKPFAVELDPPENADISKFMKGVHELKENGAGLITIADCPIARARMDSSLLACKIKRELSMEAMPHMTCRDRNLNATKALLLGLSAEGVHNVLTITGDPIPSDTRDEVKAVFNFNSRKLAAYVRSLGESGMTTPFHIYGALNVNARNFHVQLDLARQKEENGICGFLTQPVLTEQALENLKLARETLSGRLLGGIIPIISHRNACFMDSEVAGINVDKKIIALYEGADRARGEELAVTISAAVAREIAPYIDAYYLITPFGRTSLMARIMKAIREQDKC